MLRVHHQKGVVQVLHVSPFLLFHAAALASVVHLNDVLIRGIYSSLMRACALPLPRLGLRDC